MEKKKTFAKPDRRLSPLNPFVTTISRESDSPTLLSPSGSPFNEHNLRKKSIALSLRRLGPDKSSQDKVIELLFEPLKGT
jgi:hypothetical protein